MILGRSRGAVAGEWPARSPERAEVAAPEGPGEAWHLGHRPALDGLRGIAVLLVFLTHVHAPGTAFAGQVGVTMFLTLSGFLITALLLEQRVRTGTIDLGSFYARRALRLLPALVALVLVTAALVPNGAVVRSLLVLTYFGNWARIGGADLAPLSHTWSLAIEEQFYLFWPVLLLGLVRFRRTRIVVLLVGAALVVAAWRFLLSGDHDRVFFGTDTRADALLLGCALAVGLNTGWRPRVGAWAAAAALLGLLALGLVQSLAVGLAFVAPLTLALIVYGLRGSTKLGWAPLGWLGRISYGFYLWHYALLLVWWRVWFGEPLVVRSVGLLVLTLAVAAASYYLLERPFLRLKGRFAVGVARVPQGARG